MEQARPAAAALDFPGLASDVDPRDLTAGSSEIQNNLTCLVPGEMIVRGGLREVFFDEE